MDNFSVRQVTTMKEIHGIVEIQRRAWDMPDLEIVATFEMKAVSDIGVVLVAVDMKDVPIGFIYAFPQFPDAHYSHMMATLPSWQGKGVGFAMKKFHWQLARESSHKINSINWTVDPLLPNNAYLNFAKLGCVCSKYYVDYYGDPELVGIYRGIPTDRFLVRWFINDQRVLRRMKDYHLDRIDKDALLERSSCINVIENDMWINTKATEDLAQFTIQIPGDFQTLKKQSLELTIEWRYKFREFCLLYFSSGWQIIDFHSFKIDNNRENYYEFEKIKEK
ncbi:MAG: GNAT family N-acetyltransferase [Candidatus Kariarchaeaceae archaeon]